MQQFYDLSSRVLDSLFKIYFVRVIWEVQNLGILFNGGGHVNIPKGETYITWIPEMH
jgi:hypothetical protein